MNMGGIFCIHGDNLVFYMLGNEQEYTNFSSTDEFQGKNITEMFTIITIARSRQKRFSDFLGVKKVDSEGP